MRLVFPDRKHVEVNLAPGELSFGMSEECDVHVGQAEWLPHHATLAVDPQRGLWLRLEPGAGVAHVNARPIRETAMLRLGDVVSLGTIRFCVMLAEEDVIVRDLPSHRSLPSGRSGGASSSRAVLRAISGMFHGRSFSLASELLIGSAADADIRIEDAGLAPRHARVALRHDQVILRAEAPGNTLQVNGERIENAVLHPDDQIAIELHRFVIEAPGLPPRGGSDFAPRQRPITQTVPAITAASIPAHATEVAELASGRFNLGWLLLASVLIAVALAALLFFGNGFSI